MSEPKNRRIPKPFWFGIAAVLMVVLWVFLQVWFPYHREQIAIREIERLGGEIFTFWNGPKWIEHGPEWMQEIVDDGWLTWFDRVERVSLIEATVSDEVMSHLGSLTALRFLNLSNTQISDEGLKHLSSLKSLEWLTLDNTQINGEGMKHLRGLTNLYRLELNDTQISDEGLKHLSGLTNLFILSLENTQVTEEGVKELQKALPDCGISY